MVYKWKINLPVSAEVAERELSRILDEHGSLDPAVIVEQSRAEDAPLHSLFEWDDRIAAEKYRETQARFIIRNLIQEDDGAAPIRTFVHAADRGYTSLTKALNNVDHREALLAQAKADMDTFCAKYRQLVELTAVVDEMTEWRQRYA